MKIIITCLGVFIAYHFSAAQGKLFIIGGGHRPDSLMIRMVKESGVNTQGYVYILPFASAEQDSAVWYARRDFQKLGIYKIKSVIGKADNISDIIIDSVANAALIYITGGDQVRFMEIAKTNGIDHAIMKAYNAGAMIAGTSAGAAVMSHLMLTGNQKRYDYESTFSTIEKDNVELAEGLHLLTNVVIDQHFVKRSRYNRLLTVVMERPDITGIGIDESTAILLNGKEAEVIGSSQVIVIRNSKRRITKQNSNKLGATGLMVDVYLHNQKFNIYH